MLGEGRVRLSLVVIRTDASLVENLGNPGAHTTSAPGCWVLSAVHPPAASPAQPLGHSARSGVVTALACP